MKILDIIRTHYGDKFSFTFVQDEEITVFDISCEGCSNITLITTNEVADQLIRFVKPKSNNNSTNPNEKVIKLTTCEFKINRWEITTQYSVVYESQWVIHV